MSLAQAIFPDPRGLSRTPRNKVNKETKEEDDIADEVISLDQLEPTSVDPEGGDVTLGKGSFGSVQKVKQMGTNNIFALKSIRKAEVIEGQLIDQVEREIHVQGQLRHENILRLFRHFEDESCVHLLLEYCAKGELYQLLRTRKGRRFPEPTACRYFVQVCKGLQYLHKHGIVHRDLKPENLLVNSEDVVKIADFGWCAMTQSLNSARNTFCGTLDYLAPEMIRARGHDDKLDVWGLGVLLFEMIIGKPPFQSTNHAQLILKILNIDIKKVLSERNQEFPDLFSVGAQDLIFKLLQRSPQERLSIDEALKHEWVRSEGKMKRSPKAGDLSNSDSFASPDTGKAKSNGINAPTTMKKTSVTSAPGATGPGRVCTWFDAEEKHLVGRQSENNGQNEEKHHPSSGNNNARNGATTNGAANVTASASNSINNSANANERGNSRNNSGNNGNGGNNIPTAQQQQQQQQQNISTTINYPLSQWSPTCATPAPTLTGLPVTPVQQTRFLRASGCCSPIAPTRRVEPLYSENARARARSAAPRLSPKAPSPWRSPILNFREARIPTLERKMPESTPSIIALHGNPANSPAIYFRQLPNPIALGSAQFCGGLPNTANNHMCLPNRTPHSAAPRTQVNAPSYSHANPFLPSGRVVQPQLVSVPQTPLLGCRPIGGCISSGLNNQPAGTSNIVQGTPGPMHRLLYTSVNGQQGSTGVAINSSTIPNNSSTHTHTHSHHQSHTPAPAMRGMNAAAATPTAGGVDRRVPRSRLLGR